MSGHPADFRQLQDLPSVLLLFNLFGATA